MKKFIKSMLLILVLVSTILVFTGCGNTNETTENKDSKEIKNTIVGSWKYDGADYTYTFNEDGTGDYNAAGTIMEFTYETEDKKISILFNGNTAPFESEFSIDGDTLNIIDSFGKDTLYKRVK